MSSIHDNRRIRLTYKHRHLMNTPAARLLPFLCLTLRVPMRVRAFVAAVNPAQKHFHSSSGTSSAFSRKIAAGAVKSHNGLRRQQTMTRTCMILTGPSPTAELVTAAAVVMAAEAAPVPTEGVYCHRRIATKRVFSSMYDKFIGGVSSSMEPPLQTTLRELGEELGLGPLADNSDGGHDGGGEGGDSSSGGEQGRS